MASNKKAHKKPVYNRQQAQQHDTEKKGNTKNVIFRAVALVLAALMVLGVVLTSALAA